jgi:rhodanese-related sulfurtransferase
MRFVRFALACVSSFVVCSTPKQPPPLKQSVVRALLPQEFAEAIRDTHTYLVNVEPSPIGQIPGTKLVLTSQRAFDSLEVVQPDQTRPIALYCAKDTPGDSIAAQLARAGYTSVCFLRGGYRAWLDAGLPFWLFNHNQEW